MYMEAPEGYDFDGKVLKLKKALYGLKQAARAWNSKLVSVLQEHALEVSVADASLFTLKRGGRRAGLLIYVDDGFIVGMKQDTQEIINILEVFDIRKMGISAWRSFKTGRRGPSC
jgi:Reverse transcriptase (RNA-dependent DNA polymerase)